MTMPGTLKEWKGAITSVEQGYESMERHHDYTTNGYWEVQQQFQRQETEVFQLQQIWAHSEGLPRKEERMRNEEMFQMQ